MMIYFGAGDFPVAYGYWMVKMGISLSKKIGDQVDQVNNSHKGGIFFQQVATLFCELFS
jgi:hypothetical protein